MSSRAGAAGGGEADKAQIKGDDEVKTAPGNFVQTVSVASKAILGSAQPPDKQGRIYPADKVRLKFASAPSTDSSFERKKQHKDKLTRVLLSLLRAVN